MTAAFFRWAELAATISISRREERQNSGEAEILDLLNAKIMQAEMSLKSKVSDQLVQGSESSAADSTFSNGNDGKDLIPLSALLSKDNTADPTGTGVEDVGNISRSTYSWWRHRTAALNGDSDTGNDFGLTVSTYAGLALAMRRMYNYCARGADGSAPNIVCCGQEAYETYESSLDAKLRYSDTNLADLGFTSIKLHGATVIWDERMPDLDAGYRTDNSSFTDSGCIYFLNTQFQKLYVDAQTNFVTTPFVTPENQSAKVAKVLWMGNMTTSNPRKSGLLYAISPTISS